MSRKTAGGLFFVGSAQYVVFMIVAEAIYPNYSVSADFISDLGVWGQASAVVINPSLILSGVLTICGAFFLQKVLGKRYFSSFIALSGLGSLLVGFFPENTIVVSGIPVIHSIAALIAFVSGGLAAVTSYFVTAPPFRYISVFLGGLSFIALVLFLSSFSSDFSGLGPGGLERMIVYPSILWTIGFGGYLMASAE